eukprot:maker-scaffold_44-snap-gene-1.94-mRNA-1 protein AED:0.08 eAED:0.09 QI:0/0/0/1/1/1/2/0/564
MFSTKFHSFRRIVPRNFLTKNFSTSELTTSSALGLDKVGISSSSPVYRNLSYEDVAKHEKENKEGEITNNGTYSVDTGKFTGRSPKDKFIVSREGSEIEKNIWWGEINQKTSEETFQVLHEKVKNFYNGKDCDKIYVFDGYCGANKNTQKKVRIITNLAWQHHFVKNMFIRPETKEEVENFKPDFTIINGCKVVAEEYEKLGLNSEVFITFDIEKELALIGGTWYGGEMKKGIFSMMNYWLPNQDIMPMHCSANIGKNKKTGVENTALFFGTGKTTISADPHRNLIGDDEHGWDSEGVFNFEGGCYAKTIDLSRESEPEIYDAIKTNALLENVVLKNGEPDYTDGSKTQNTRVSYPLEHIPNHQIGGKGGHPENIIFLTCDAYGVLPPVSKLSSGQAMYHFLSGYTAKVAGTERGVTEPQATFSPCFGAAFLPLHPTRYADLLERKVQDHKSNVYLVNTGWTGGVYGVGNRMSIHDTRECVDNILDGSLAEFGQEEFEVDPIFGFQVPKKLGNIAPSVLIPRESWEDKEAYDKQRIKLAKMFQDNFSQYVTPGHTDYTEYGPKL